MVHTVGAPTSLLAPAENFRDGLDQRVHLHAVRDHPHEPQAHRCRPHEEVSQAVEGCVCASWRAGRSWRVRRRGVVGSTEEGGRWRRRVRALCATCMRVRCVRARARARARRRLSGERAAAAGGVIARGHGLGRVVGPAEASRTPGPSLLQARTCRARWPLLPSRGRRLFQ